MFKHLSHQQIDKTAWDECIDHSSQGIIYALSWYLDIVSPAWEALVIEEKGKYLTVVPLPVKMKYGMRHLNQPLLTQLLGVFGEEDGFIIAEVKLRIEKLFKIVVSYNFNTNNSIRDENILHTIHLDLSKSYKQIIEGYHVNRVRQLKKAKAENLQVNISKDIEQLVQLFDENVAHRISGLIGENYEYKVLRKIYTALIKRDMGYLYTTQTKDGDILAIALILKYRQKLIYLFSATSDKGKDLNAVTVLIDSVFQEYAERGYVFDFESPEVSSVREFYRRFGGDFVPYSSLSYDRLPQIIRWVRMIKIALFKPS